ncbi:MAG: endolytic transglycosylase MltG [Pseudomonadota bacterium]
MSDNAVEKKKGGGLFLKLFLGFCVLALLCVVGAAYGGWHLFTGPGPAASETVVDLPPGSSVGAIASRLENAGVISDERVFKAASRLTGTDQSLKAGEYAFPARVSVQEILVILREGRSILYKITAPEGLTTAQILAIVDADETLQGEITVQPGEGRLLPETYLYHRRDTKDDVVRQMMKAQDAVRDALWDLRATELPFDTWEEAVILASIVEKETAFEAERPQVAAVFVNRLKRRMRLESDPTIIYGLTGGEPLGRGIRQSELRKETPYNTYIIRGLPPTPIANPGRASIAAVLNPPDTNDLFFVADGTGGHVFSSTYAEHRRNVEKWRRIERERRSAN